MEKKLSYSLLSQTERIKLKNLVPLPMPLSLYVDPSSYCNYQCSFCARNHKDYRKFAGLDTFLDMDVFGKLSRELQEWGALKSLKLYNLGEPFLNPNILEIIREAMHAKIAERIEITTNGSMLTKELSDGLVFLCRQYSTIPLYLRFSISSVIPERHIQITSCPVTVQQIHDNIAYLWKIRTEKQQKLPFIYVKMIDPCSDERRNFIEYYRDIADEVQIEEPMNWNGYENFRFDAPYKSQQPQCLNNGLQKRQSRKACPYPFYSLVINADADVVCCCVDWNRMTKVGNLRDQTLKDIWFGNALHEFQTLHLNGLRHLNPGCQNCYVLNRCPPDDDIDGVPAEQLKKNTSFFNESEVK